MRMTALAWGVLALSLAGTPALATSTKLLSLDHLIKQSSTVVAADVTAKEAVWRGRFLKTKVMLKIADCIKGSCEQEEVEVETWGGERDGITMRVDGSTQFNVGEKVVVFLRPLKGPGGGDSGMLHTVGMAQGKFVPAFGQQGMLTRDEAGMRMVGALAAPGGGPIDGGDELDAGIVDDDPSDASAQQPKAGFDTLQGLTLTKLRGRIKQVAIITPGDVGGPNRLGAERTVQEPVVGQPQVDDADAP